MNNHSKNKEELGSMEIYSEVKDWLFMLIPTIVPIIVSYWLSKKIRSSMDNHELLNIQLP